MKKTTPVIVFTLAYLAIAIFFALQNTNWEFVFYIAIVILIGMLALLLHKRIGLATGLLWGLSVWGLLHMLGGLFPVPDGLPINGTKRVLYSLWLIPGYLKFDHVVHAFGFFVATWICWYALKKVTKLPKSSVGLLMLCVFAGMGLGAINELVEFTAVLLIPSTNVGGYTNTGRDLVSNLAGCVLAAVMIRFTERT